jgi:formylglycine-generating enzyme required for sulfatase activity/transcriptional regulator CtsR
MTSKQGYLALRLITTLLSSLLLFSCGTDNTKNQTNHGAGIAFQLKWPAAKSVASAPAGVTTVRVSISAPDMTTIANNFSASDGTGLLTNVPPGSNRTITIQGLNSSSSITHQVAVPNVTLEPGKTYNCGTVTMIVFVDLANVPANPSGLSATAASSTQINLAWLDNSNNETGFKIERKTGVAGTYTQIATVAANVISYQDTTTLTATTTYYYRIKASNGNGDSGYATEANTTTLPPVETAPSAPTGLSATAISSTQINLAWTDNSTNETGFKLERKTGSGGTYTQIATPTTNSTTYNDTGLSASTTYYYRIRATNGIGDSGNATETSAITTLTIPTAPSVLNAFAASPTQISLFWTDNSNNEFGFKIERKTGAGGTYAEIATVTTNVTIYNDTGLTASTAYYYRIRATNSAGDSAYTTEANATTTAVVVLTYSISGAITSGGSALAGVSVALTGSGAAQVTTDSSGNYSISSAQNGSYTLTPSMTGYTFSPTTLPITVNGANLTGQNFAASGIGTIAGWVKVNGGSNSPIIGATVSTGTYSTTTDSNGNFTLSLPVGTYNLAVSATGYQTSSTNPGTVTAGNMTPVNVALNPSASNGTISGWVRINGGTNSPIVGATVSTGTYSTTTDSNGNFTLSLPAGTYNLVVSAANYQTSSTNPGTVTAGNMTPVNVALNPIGGTITDPTTGMVLLKVTGGTFTMGDTLGDGYSDELPTHQVTVNDFYIGKYEVTQGQWQAVMGSNPSSFSSCGTTCPVEQVNWTDVQTFITTLNQKSGKSYRLPTEAEWEYVARSGGKSERYSGSSDVSAVAWYVTNSGNTTHQVGQKQANGLGLYDMSGNVWEWVNDWYGSYSSTAQANPTGPTSGSTRVIRGGSWSLDALYARASFRYYSTPDLRYNRIGFRLVAPVQ